MLEKLRILLGNSKKTLLFIILSFIMGFGLSQFILNGVPVIINLGFGILAGVIATILYQWIIKLFGDETFEIKTVGSTVFVNGVVPATSTGISLLHDFQRNFVEENKRNS